MRRELFDTAWKISKRYGFPDEYRLTEKQISQYNDILMEPDFFKKEVRMSAIQSEFVAYPPFWYYWGHNENLIAQSYEYGSESWTYYRELSLERFSYFEQINTFPLLRTDLTAASCYLEMCDMLNPESEKGKIIELAERALKVSGQANDVKQLCAFKFLCLKEFERAKDLLLSLIVDGFSPIINAQILSHIYSFQVYNGSNDAHNELEQLYRFFSPELLCRIPNEGESFNDVCKEFLSNQKLFAVGNARFVLDKLVDKYAIRLNRLTQTPIAEKSYPDEYFSDKTYSKDFRYAEIELAKRTQQFTPSFDTKKLVSEYSFSLNEYINHLYGIIDDEKMVSALNQQVFSLFDYLYNIDGQALDYDRISMRRIVEKCNADFFKALSTNINDSEDIYSLTLIEDKIRTLCYEEKLMEYDKIFLMAQNIPERRYKNKIVLGATIGIEQIRAKKEIREQMMEACKKNALNIVTGHSAQLCVNGTPEYERFLRDYKSHISMFKDTELLTEREGAIAFLHLGETILANFLNDRIDNDIILTEDEFIKLNYNLRNVHVKYTDIICEDRVLKQLNRLVPLVSDEYININELYSLIQELRKIKKSD